MAKEAKPAEAAEPANAVPPRKSKKLLIIFAAALVVFLAVGGTAVFFLMKGQNNKDAENGEVASENTKIDKKKGAKEVAPVYVALDAFTVNLVPENGDQFLQLTISVEVANLYVGDRLKTYTPKLRNNIMMLLSGKKASELVTKDGKEALANEIRDQINDILEQGNKEKTEDGPVKEVLFTSFIIQ